MSSSSAQSINVAQLTIADYGLYIVLVLSWSASWYALALQVGEVPVSTSLFWRFAIAASVMWIWVGIAREPLTKPSLSDATRQNSKSSGSNSQKLDIVPAFEHSGPHQPLARAAGATPSLHAAFAGMGLFIFCLNFTLFYYGSAYLISGLLSVVFSLASLFNLILGFLISRAIPTSRVVFGACLGFAGIAFMFWPEIAGQSWTGTGVLGLGLCVAGTLSFCTGSQISASLQRRKISVLRASAWGMSYGAGFSGLFVILSGNSFAILWTPTYILSLLFLAIVSSVIAFWSYLTLLGRIGAGRAGYATVMFPVIALLISTVFENYQFQPIAIVGLLLVMAGNVLVLGKSKARLKP